MSALDEELLELEDIADGLGRASHFAEERMIRKAVTSLRAQLAEKDARIERLTKALKWVAGHAYAGGKSFGDVEPVKSALEE